MSMMRRQAMTRTRADEEKMRADERRKESQKDDHIRLVARDKSLRATLAADERVENKRYVCTHVQYSTVKPILCILDLHVLCYVQYNYSYNNYSTWSYSLTGLYRVGLTWWRTDSCTCTYNYVLTRVCILWLVSSLYFGLVHELK